MKNFYDILGVPKDAPAADIKRAYRTLTLKYHPDRNPSPDAEDKIREINEAYETLSDSGKKKQYDFELSGGGGVNMEDLGDIGNLFNMMFGGGMPGMGGPGGPEIRIFHGGMPPGMGMPGMHNPFGQGGLHGHPLFHQQHHKPGPITKTLTITMEQCYAGCSMPIEIDRWIYIGDMKCNELETVYINVPRGIDENEFILIHDKGNAMNDRLKGDVKVNVQVENTSAFKRQGLDLIYKKKITLKEALCGFSFEISHLNGKTFSLNNKTNSTVVKPNYRKTVQGLGMVRDTATGNMVIEFEIEFPEALTEEQIAKLSDAL